MIHMLVSRCHVADSNRAVIRYVISRLKNGYATYKSLPRAARRELMAAVIECHTENRALYDAVVTGRF